MDSEQVVDSQVLSKCRPQRSGRWQEQPSRGNTDGQRAGGRFPGVVNDHYDEQQRVWQFGQKEYSDDNNEHHRGHVSLRQAATLGFPVLREQLATSTLCLAHGAHKQRVEDDED